MNKQALQELVEELKSELADRDREIEDLEQERDSLQVDVDDLQGTAMQLDEANERIGELEELVFTESPTLQELDKLEILKGLFTLRLEVLQEIKNRYL